VQPAERPLTVKAELGRCLGVGGDVEEHQGGAAGRPPAVVLDLGAADRAGAVVADGQIARFVHRPLPEIRTTAS
jgi:hypothetical protein